MLACRATRRTSSAIGHAGSSTNLQSGRSSLSVSRCVLTDPCPVGRVEVSAGWSAFAATRPGVDPSTAVPPIVHRGGTSVADWTHLTPKQARTSPRHAGDGDSGHCVPQSRERRCPAQPIQFPVRSVNLVAQRAGERDAPGKRADPHQNAGASRESATARMCVAWAGPAGTRS